MEAKVKIIGQISAAENILHVFPSNKKMGDFSARALKKVPGIVRCGICICGEPHPCGDLLSGFCEGCDIVSRSVCPDEELLCRFDGNENHETYFLHTPACFFGFLILEIADPDTFSLYSPFVSNFSNTMTIHMENLWQKEQLQLQLAKKADSLARMAGAIAHHYNNQLSVVMGNLELALKDIPADVVYHDNLTAAMRAARKSSEISGLMLTYLGQGSGKTSQLDLSRLCRSYLPILRTLLPKDIALETEFMSAGPKILANLNHMQIILTHLITNAAEAIGDNTGRIRLSIGVIPVFDIPGIVTAPAGWHPEAGMYACLEVTDTGTGIAEQNMEKLFDPFFTTKFIGRGLGLSVILGLVKSWKGAVCVGNTKGRGTRVRIYLPVQEHTIAAQPDPTIK
jgi:signal transduction histidine kinase